MSFEAYKIAVKLSLVNNVSSGLVALATQFQSLNRHIDGANASMGQLECCRRPKIDSLRSRVPIQN